MKSDFNQPLQRLHVFLCHSSCDKPVVRKLYQRLRKDGFDPWLDEENLVPGQSWPNAISKAVRSSDVVIVCLSRSSITKAGFVQKEIKIALDVADEQPEGRIFLIPLKLERCEVPERLSQLHWVNYYEKQGYNRLIKALEQCADKVGVNDRHSSSANDSSRSKLILDENINDRRQHQDSGGYQFERLTGIKKALVTITTLLKSLGMRGGVIFLLVLISILSAFYVLLRPTEQPKSNEQSMQDTSNTDNQVSPLLNDNNQAISPNSTLQPSSTPNVNSSSTSDTKAASGNSTGNTSTQSSNSMQRIEGTWWRDTDVPKGVLDFEFRKGGQLMIRYLTDDQISSTTTGTWEQFNNQIVMRYRALVPGKNFTFEPNSADKIIQLQSLCEFKGINEIECTDNEASAGGASNSYIAHRVLSRLV